MFGCVEPLPFKLCKQRSFRSSWSGNFFQLCAVRRLPLCMIVVREVFSPHPEFPFQCFSFYWYPQSLDRESCFFYLQLLQPQTSMDLADISCDRPTQDGFIFLFLISRLNSVVCFKWTPIESCIYHMYQLSTQMSKFYLVPLGKQLKILLFGLMDVSYRCRLALWLHIAATATSHLGCDLSRTGDYCDVEW